MAGTHTFKLGRRAHDVDPRNLSFNKYAASLPLPPDSIDWTKGITDFGMMLNSDLGDCTIAACGHAVQILTANISTEITVPDQIIENYYSYWDGYVPGDPSTDQGGIPTVVLNHWRQHTFNGHKLVGYVAPATQNLTEIKQAISLFGGCYIGLNVPNYVMNNLTAPGSTWDLEPDDGIAGGHAVWCCGYDSEKITVISWGSLYYLTNQFWATYVDEAFALLSDDWFNWAGNKLSASGMNFKQLWADLAQL